MQGHNVGPFLVKGGANLAHNGARGDRRAGIVQNRGQLVRRDMAFVHDQLPHLAVAVLLDHKNHVVGMDKFVQALVKRKRPDAHHIDGIAVFRQYLDRLVGRRGRGAEEQGPQLLLGFGFLSDKDDS